ncbi:MAG TPA: SusC/RagA family TonB-linked outer membrane protein [Chitinophagaceae bacterium]|nr:SusC/RagA family TonB-linked outer membrane protein [Chitinophagaceae bacterium]
MFTKTMQRAVGLLLLSFCLLSAVFAQEETGSVNGIVRKENGEAAAAVTVVAKNSETGQSTSTLTDSAGVFRFSKLPVKGNYSFAFSSIGFQTQTLSGYSIKPNSSISIITKLQGQASSLNEVVVVGYGTTRKGNLTGAVAQVSSEVLENRSLSNLSQGLQGVVPNLNLRPGDGKPTQSPAFNIRGTTSIGQGGNALVLIDGVQGDPAMINPNDIATISVLKDAASSAIYGARAAFGVVLITTKNPARDKTSVTYSANYAFKSPTAMPEIVSNGYQYAKMFNEGWSSWNDGQIPQNINKTQTFSLAYLDELKKRDADPTLKKTDTLANGNYVYYENTDWFKVLYKPHTNSVEHNLAISGNSGKASFYITGRSFGQDGIFRYNSDDYKIYNLRGKGAIQVYPWLRIENNIDFSSMKYHNPLNVGEGGGIWRNIADEGHPTSPMFNPDGTLTYSAAYTVGDFVYGKNGINMNRQILRNTTAFSSNFFNNKFRVKGDFTFQNNNYNQVQTRVIVPYSVKPGIINYVGTNYNDIEPTYQQTQYLAANIYGEYETRLGSNHYVKLLAGYNYEQSTYKQLKTLRNGLIYPDAQDINLALGQSIVTTGGYDKWAILGGFYRLNYSFKDKYLLEADGRYDGSSKFPSNQRYAFFPSVSAGWRVSKEAFWKVSPSLVSDLKIRGSYGSLGNGNINSYAFQELFSISQSGRVLNGVRPQRTAQPNVLPDGLTWETSTTADLGLDLTMLRSRLVFSGDIYRRNTTNMFTVGPALPAVFGTDVPKGNYADLSTKGFELALSWNDRFNAGSKPFTYDIQLTLADNIATITKYNNPTKRINNINAISNPDYYVGQTVGEIWGFVTEGFFTKDNIGEASKQKLYKASNGGNWAVGDIKFADLNKDGTIDIGDNTVNKPGDKKVIGNSAPRYTYGINLGAGWNNFFFAVFFQGVGKQDWWPGAEADYFWGQYNRPYNNALTSQIGKIWSEDNPNAYFPKLRGYVAQNGQGELAQIQTRYLQSVAYLRMKNIQLGYNLPQALIRKAKMNAARVYVSGENLWTHSPLYKINGHNLDPENTGGSDRVLTDGSNGNGNNYPMLKSVTVGLSITF